MRRKSFRWLFFTCLNCILFARMLSGDLGLPEVAAAQAEVRTRVSQAAALFYKDPAGARTGLRRLGSPAIPFMMEMICANDEKIPLNKVRRDPFLVDVIAEYRNKESDDALVTLLSSKCPNIRGLAAKHLGNHKTRSAIPHLINLLGDKEIYLGYVVSHGKDYEVLVRDMAIDALQNITGKKLAKRSTKAVQAQAWLDWWTNQQGSKH